MRKLNYRLIMSDFDGTLFRSDHTVAPETVEKINEYVSAGGVFVVNTGRGISAILPQMREFGLKGIVAAHQGSTVADIETGEVIVDGSLTTEEAIRICETFEKEKDAHIRIFTLHDFYTNQDENNEYRRIYEEITKTKGITFEGKSSDFVKKLGKKIKKINMHVEPKDKKRIFERVNGELGEDLYVTYSAVVLLEVSSKKYSKGTALAFIANRFGVPIEKTIAVGDNMNDLPMLKAAGLGLPVANASEDLKEILPAYRYSNDENAVGRIIEEYGFMGEEE